MTHLLDSCPLRRIAHGNRTLSNAGNQSLVLNLRETSKATVSRDSFCLVARPKSNTAGPQESLGQKLAVVRPFKSTHPSPWPVSSTSLPSPTNLTGNPLSDTMPGSANDSSPLLGTRPQPGALYAPAMSLNFIPLFCTKNCPPPSPSSPPPISSPSCPQFVSKLFLPSSFVAAEDSW